MWMLKMNGKKKTINKKGFALVEVLCSFLIFSLVFTSIFNLRIYMDKLEIRDKMIEDYYCYLSGLKYNLLKNFTYNEIKQLKEENKLNIFKENINADLLCEENFNYIFKKENPMSYPYVTIKIEDFKESDVLKVKLYLYFTINNTEKNISTEFLKGSY